MRSPTYAATIAVALGLSLTASQAVAINRYQSTALACASIQATIAHEGAAIMRWVQSPDILRYDRYVAHGRYCDVGKVARTTTIPSADTARCPVLACRVCERDSLGILSCY